MKTLNDFSKVKSFALDKLMDFKMKFVTVLEGNSEITNIKFIEEKLNNVIKNIENDEIIIALFGAFSDGKSTLVKALTGIDDIEISPAPTTDKVTTYRPADNSYIIVDTPGLFSENDIHSDITKRYISEANLILYVVDAINPLKESQHNTISWIMNDLNKVESTIFLINKMDLVCDIEDEEEYEEMSQIKINNVYQTIRDISKNIIITNIIPVSADPYGKGIEYWNNHKEKYIELSRFEKINEKLVPLLNERKTDLIDNKVKSVIKDCSSHLINELTSLLEIKKNLVEIEQSNLEYIISNMNILSQDVDIKYTNIIERFEQLRIEYTNKIHSLSDPKDFNEYYDLMLGDEFYLLEEKVNNIIREETENLLKKQINIVDDIKNNVKKYDEQKNKAIELGTKLTGVLGGKISALPNDMIKSGIKIFRDTSNLPIKFKPWGMKKLADKFKVGSSVISIGTSGLEAYLEYSRQQKWESFINDHRDSIAEIFKDLKQEFSYENYKHTYFPAIEIYYKDKEKKEKLLDTTRQENKWLEGYIEEIKRFSGIA